MKIKQILKLGASSPAPDPALKPQEQTLPRILRIEELEPRLTPQSTATILD